MVLVITEEQLQTYEFIPELQTEVDNLIFNSDEIGAYKLLRQLEPLLRKVTLNSDLKQQYDDLEIKLSFLTLSHLTTNEIVELFKNHFIQGLAIEDIDILEQLKRFLILYDPWTRDEPRKLILEAIKQNNEILVVSSEKKELTVMGCLNDYNQILGTGRVNKVKQAEYFAEKFVGLEETKKELIKKIFGIYEYLKLTSKMPEAFEEDLIFMTDEGEIQILKDGRLMPAPTVKIEKTERGVLEETLEKENDEIEKLKKQQVMAPPININQAVDTAITKVGLTFPDEILEKRFKNVVFSYLREVRGEIETRIVLKRPQKIGGVELDETTVDKVMDILKQEKPMIKIEPMGNLPQIELAEGLKQPEETIQKFTRMEKSAEKTVPEIKPVSSLPKMEEEKFLPQPEETKEKLLKEKFEQEPLAAPIIKKPQPMTQTYADKNTDLRGQGEAQPVIPEIKLAKEEPKLAMPEIKPVLPPVLEKKIEEPSFIKAAEDKKTAPNLFTAVVEKPKTDLPVEILKKEEISGPEEITGVLKELDQLPAEDLPFVLDEDAEDKFKLPVKELPKEELKPTETQTYADRDTDLRGQEETRIYLDKKTPPILEKKIEEIKKEIKPQPQAEIFIHRPPREPAMSKMEEIKVTPRVSGPIEELQGVTLQDFRRWGSSEQAVQKIKEKIDLLGEESLVKKSEGIKAWKESEINKLYLDIGTESIDKGISVSEVIILRQKENRKTLNEEEFDKVVELNQNLRF
ncbi:MAG: hypothetical protein WC697_04065 [Patescibacteria group bacterium]|jgi:hypothetical protein